MDCPVCGAPMRAVLNTDGTHKEWKCDQKHGFPWMWH